MSGPLKNYNGWRGVVRTTRGAKFYQMLKDKKIPPPKTCAMCGQEHGPVWNTYHAEDYGSTWDDYLQEAKPVCPRCHGMIHSRFRFKNRWKRYKQRILQPNFGGLGTFKTLNDVFAYMRQISDIEYIEDAPTGILWLDQMPLVPYSGPEKIATAIVAGEEIPDPEVYGVDWDTMKGVIFRASGELIDVEWEQVPHPDFFK